MRLFDTYSKSLVELPAQPGPVRMYFCGPTVYARAHVGNARPFVIGMWLRAWLRETGYQAVLVHNITDVNDKIYDAAPGASAALAAQATRWYLDDTAGFGLGMPDHMPKVTEMVPEIVAFIEELVEKGYAYAVGGDVYFRVAQFAVADVGRMVGLFFCLQPSTTGWPWPPRPRCSLRSTRPQCGHGGACGATVGTHTCGR